MWIQELQSAKTLKSFETDRQLCTTYQLAKKIEYFFSSYCRTTHGTWTNFTAVFHQHEICSIILRNGQAASSARQAPNNLWLVHTPKTASQLMKTVLLQFQKLHNSHALKRKLAKTVKSARYVNERILLLLLLLLLRWWFFFCFFFGWLQLADKRFLAGFCGACSGLPLTPLINRL